MTDHNIEYDKISLWKNHQIFDLANFNFYIAIIAGCGTALLSLATFLSGLLIISPSLTNVRIFLLDALIIGVIFGVLIYKIGFVSMKRARAYWANRDKQICAYYRRIHNEDIRKELEDDFKRNMFNPNL